MTKHFTIDGHSGTCHRAKKAKTPALTTNLGEMDCALCTQEINADPIAPIITAMTIGKRDVAATLIANFGVQALWTQIETERRDAEAALNNAKTREATFSRIMDTIREAS